jgi:hypothetical protein
MTRVRPSDINLNEVAADALFLEIVRRHPEFANPSRKDMADFRPARF